jgi:lycopene beta-cyclase
VIFVGGGLATTLLLNELRSALPGRVAVVEPWPPSERPPVHWSYWSRVPTPYDRFAVGIWRWARIADALSEPIAPFALRLVRSTDVLAVVSEALKDLPVERLRTTARSIIRADDGLYEIVTDAGIVRARWVFDSACGSLPPSRRQTGRGRC